MEDFFKQTGKFYSERTRELHKWKAHHLACVEEIDKQLEQMDKIPKSIDDILGITND